MQPTPLAGEAPVADAVTPEAVREIAADLLVRPMSLAVIGPFDDHEFGSVLG